MSFVRGDYCCHLSSDDLIDPELAIVRSRAVGGTMLLWRKCIDPFVSIHPVTSSAFLPIILKLPDAQVSIHIAIYLPTSGKDAEFVTELASLRICLENLLEMYDDPVIYIRGDGNTNKKNHSRVSILDQFLTDFSLSSVKIDHIISQGRANLIAALISYCILFYQLSLSQSLRCSASWITLKFSLTMTLFFHGSQFQQEVLLLVLVTSSQQQGLTLQKKKSFGPLKAF